MLVIYMYKCVLVVRRSAGVAPEIYDMIWYDDVARSGICAYMLGLSVNSVILVEGTLFFIFSFHPSSFSILFFYICFPSCSSSSSSFLILSSLSSYKFFCSLLLFLDFTFKRWLWGIHCTQSRYHASVGIHPGFETQSRHHQKVKTGYQWPHEKDRCISKN